MNSSKLDAVQCVNKRFDHLKLVFKGLPMESCKRLTQFKKSALHNQKTSEHLQNAYWPYTPIIFSLFNM